MADDNLLTDQFEAHRSHLRSVAYRMLGSLSEADDAVQETWLKLSRTDTGDVEHMGGWLTTVVARVCLDMLRSRQARREEPLETDGRETNLSGAMGDDPEQEALLADSVGLALLVVLNSLNPAERLAFVLHDMFAVPFEEIASIVGRSPMAARQLASRARRRVQGAAARTDPHLSRQREIVEAFLAASRGGDFDALVALLDPDIVVRFDPAAVEMGAAAEARGALAAARTFAGRAQAVRLALVDGAVGAAWAPGRQARIVFNFTITEGKIVAIDVVADPTRVGQMDVMLL